MATEYKPVDIAMMREDSTSCDLRSRQFREGAVSGCLNEIEYLRAENSRLTAFEAKNARLRQVLGSMLVSYDLIQGERSPLSTLAKGVVAGFFVETVDEVRAALAGKDAPS